MIEKHLQDITLRKYGSVFEEAFGMLPLTYFGARGDNLTDNYANIQVAIDETIKRGLKYIFVPTGTYLYSGILLNVDKVIFVGNSAKAKIYDGENELRIYQIGTVVDRDEIDLLLQYKGDSIEINQSVTESGYIDIETNIKNACDAMIIVGEDVVQTAGDLNLRNGKIFNGVPMHSSSDNISLGENVHVSHIEIVENAIRLYYTVTGEEGGTIKSTVYWRVR